MTSVIDKFPNDICIFSFLTQLSERETYSQRQSLLAEIEAIRQREATIRRKDEVDLR